MDRYYIPGIGPGGQRDPRGHLGDRLPGFAEDRFGVCERFP